jgi:hypothetical protein
MPELEQLLRASAPRTSRAPAELEWAIWTTLTGDGLVAGPAVAEPELVVDEPSPPRRPGSLLPLIGVAAVAAILLAAVLVAGLRNREAQPASGDRSATAPAPPTGRIYVESSCPEEARGACFEPFPAGRYTFHKANPQVTLTVPDGWRNDESWTWGVVLSRPDTPGATLQILDHAERAVAKGCDVTADDRVGGASRIMAVLARIPGLTSTGPDVARIGERRGSTIDLTAPAGLRGLRCPGGVTGTPILAPSADPEQLNNWSLALPAGESARVTLADGSNGHTIALVGTVRGGEAALRAWMAKAAPIVASITFAPCTTTHVSFGYCEDLATSSP